MGRVFFFFFSPQEVFDEVESDSQGCFSQLVDIAGALGVLTDLLPEPLSMCHLCSPQYCPQVTAGLCRNTDLTLTLVCSLRNWVVFCICYFQSQSEQPTTGAWPPSDRLSLHGSYAGGGS